MHQRPNSHRHEPSGHSNDGRRGDDAVNSQCTHCDERIDPEEWHPVATLRDEEGTAEIHDFCCEDCRSAWLDGNGDD